MGILSKIFNNTRKPEGFFGRMMVSGMNGGTHAAMAIWGLDRVDIPASGFRDIVVHRHEPRHWLAVTATK